MSVFLAIAYRYGWTNSHQYFVACSPDESFALAAAERTWADRVGKYGVSVQEMPEDLSMARPRSVRYFPSAYGEAAPSECARIQAFQTLGQRAYGAVTHKKTLLSVDGRLVALPVEVPEWLRLEAQRAALVHGIAYAPQPNPQPPLKKKEE